MIFFAADPGATRLLAPQFRFHFAGDLPTYATSEIYVVAARGSDPDLNGVIFADIPWLLAPDASTDALRDSLLRYWPQRTTRWQRLYGLGFDAYRMLPLLYNPGVQFYPHPNVVLKLEYRNFSPKGSAERPDEVGIGMGFAF